MHSVITRLRNKKADEGFTLIELLVVVVIIGVLVAIAVPVYLNYRKGAADKSAQSDVRGAVSTIEQYYTDNANTYPATLTSKTASFSLYGAAGTPSGSSTSPGGWVTLSDQSTVSYVLAAGGTTYLVCAKNAGGSGKTYVYDSSVGGSVKTSATAVSMTTCT